jgi:hypothetical protein
VPIESRNSAIWSGWSMSAFIAAAIEYLVVSLPALTISTKKFLNSSSVSCSPSIVGASSLLITSSVGCARALGAARSAYWYRSSAAGERNGMCLNSSVSVSPSGCVVISGSKLPISASPRSTSHGPSSSGTPSKRPSIRIGSCFATSSTKSNVDGPASASSTTCAGEQPDGVLVRVHLASGERLRHQAPVAGVLRRVVLEHVAASRKSSGPSPRA